MPQLSFPFRWLCAIAVAAALVVWSVNRYDPRVSDTLEMVLELTSSPPGHSDPILATGRRDAGDLLFVRWIDQDHVIFGYDSWGAPIVLSTVRVPVTPGQSIRLLIKMPGLHQRFGEPASTSRIWVQCDGRVVLDMPVAFHFHETSAVFFAENRIGSTWAGRELQGKVKLPSGVELRGTAKSYMATESRLLGWLVDRPQQGIATLLIAALAFWGASRLPTTISSWRRVISSWRALMFRHRTCLTVMTVVAACFTAAITYGTFRLWEAEPFGVFYDYQATSLLYGRLDVPNEAIGGEAFVVNGKLYGYFGPTPAVLRMPFAVFEVALGRLTRAYMLAYLMAALVAAYWILCDLTRSIRGPDAMPSRWAIVIVLGNAGIGSTLFFLGSRAMMYHEAILCGAMFALWSNWCALRQLRAPATRWWVSSLLFGLLSVHARPPTGLYALTLLGCVALFQAVRGIDPSGKAPTGRPAAAMRNRITALGICAAAAIALLSFNGLAYLKFKTFDGAPLRLSRPYGPERLAHIDGKSFHAANVPFGFYWYVQHPNYRLEPRFPYLLIGSTAEPRQFPNSKIDLHDYIAAMPYSMPGLFVLATAGTLIAFFRVPSLRWATVIVWLAVLPMSIALFAAIALAQRYTGDFCPFLIVGAAIGTVTLDGGLHPLWRIFRAVTTLLTLAAAAASFAMVLDYQGTWAPNLSETTKGEYQRLFHRIDEMLGFRRP